MLRNRLQHNLGKCEPFPRAKSSSSNSGIAVSGAEFPAVVGMRAWTSCMKDAKVCFDTLRITNRCFSMRQQPRRTTGA